MAFAVPGPDAAAGLTVDAEAQHTMVLAVAVADVEASCTRRPRASQAANAASKAFLVISLRRSNVPTVARREGTVGYHRKIAHYVACVVAFLTLCFGSPWKS